MGGVLEGKVATVTGAASGIGRATAKLFAAEGAVVVAADRAEAVDAMIVGIRDLGGVAEAVCLDAGAEADIEALVSRAVHTYSGLDIFYANAGISGGVAGGFFDASPADWLKVLRSYLAVKHAAPRLAERGGGTILCTASEQPKQVAYVISEAQRSGAVMAEATGQAALAWTDHPCLRVLEEWRSRSDMQGMELQRQAGEAIPRGGPGCS